LRKKIVAQFFLHLGKLQALYPMNGFRLGSIGGFEIRVDLSWLLIFFLILWTLTANVFPANAPGLSRGVYIGMGIVGTVFFFVSLILHELSHSVVARAKGIPVEGITLFVFGGVSRTRMDAEAPGDEFQIAVVGPLTSLALAALFGLIWYMGQNSGLSPALNGVTAYLAWINVLLAVFNLLPGFPLDGGRLFRSAVWKFTGSLKKATRVASIGGRILGYGLIFLGFWQLFSPVPNFIGGLWFILIGWFLNTAAEASYQDLMVRTMLEGAQVQQVMTLDPETVSSDLSLQMLMDEYFFNRNYQSFPVMEGDRPIGLVTLSQVKQVSRDEWSSRTVQDIMTPIGQGIKVDPQEDMATVLDRMRETESQRLLVVRDSELVGILSVTDLANWLQRKRELGENIPPRSRYINRQRQEFQSSEA
jgi:Zn-dependent protease/predicted transcriptional regulator